MDIKTFWSIIDKAREEAGDWEEMMEPLTEALARLEVAEIIEWQHMFYEYQNLSYKNKL